MRRISLLTCLLAATTSALAAPDPAQALLAKLKRAYPGTHFTHVSRTPVPHLFEVQLGNTVAYVGHNPRYWLFGRLIDVQRMADLTAPKLGAEPEPAAAPQRLPFDQLPLQDAIRTVRGTGSRQLAVFSDPHCPYCRALERALAELDDLTVYTFLLGPDDTLIQSIWCAADPAAAWNAYMVREDRSLLAPEPSCATPLLRNRALATLWQLPGTPVLIRSDGQVRFGAATAAELAAWLGSPSAGPTTSSNRESP